MNARAFGQVFKNTVLVDIEYRFNYFVLFLSSVITLVMEWAIFKNVYEGRTEVAGLPLSSAFAFILCGMLLRTLQSVWGPIFVATEEIREGSFRRYLLQPIFHPAYFLAQILGTKFTPAFASALICVLYKSFGEAPSAFLSLHTLPAALASIALSTVLLWIFYLVIVYAAFFMDESAFLTTTTNIATSLLSGSLLPLAWYPESVQRVLMATPLPLFGDWPIRATLGLLSPEEHQRYLFTWALWCAAAFALAVFMYRRGLKRYESFGG